MNSSDPGVSHAHGNSVSPNDAVGGHLQVQFGGICALIFDGAHAPLKVVLPDGRQPRYSRNRPDHVVPAHHPFVIFELTDLADGSRQPDFSIDRKWGVVLLDREQLSLVGATQKGVTQRGGEPGTDDHAGWIIKLAEVCEHAAISPKNVAFPPTEKVAAHVTLDGGELSTVALTEARFAFAPACTGLPPVQPRRLAQLVSVDMDIDSPEVAFRSHSFDSVPPRPDLRFRFSDSGQPVRVVVANMPLSEIQAFVTGEASSHSMHDHTEDLHFELYYELAAAAPAPPLTIPVMRDKVPHASNCPVVIGDVAGGNG